MTPSTRAPKMQSWPQQCKTQSGLSSLIEFLKCTNTESASATEVGEPLRSHLCMLMRMYSHIWAGEVLGLADADLDQALQYHSANKTIALAEEGDRQKVCDCG